MNNSSKALKLLARLCNHRNHLARFYDAGEQEFDRYTIVYLTPDCTDEHGVNWFSYRSASEYPFSPCGLGIIGQHEGAALDWLRIARLGSRNHLGKRVCFDQLPADVQTLVVRDLS
jgi:hypothetical protein